MNPVAQKIKNYLNALRKPEWADHQTRMSNTMLQEALAEIQRLELALNKTRYVRAWNDPDFGKGATER